MESSDVTSAVWRRLARGISATALAPIITAAIQLGSVPLLLSAWGASKYGDWLLLSAIPSYLSLSDLGFGDASATDMTLRVAAGDREGALRTFQSSWVLLTVVSILIGLVAVPLTWFVPWQPWLHLSSLTSGRAELVILVLAIYTLASQQVGVLQSGYWCEGNYATGSLWLSLLRFIETAVATVVGVMTGDLLAVAFTYLAARVVGTLAFREALRRRSPWLVLGFQHATLNTVKSMAGPAVGFIAIPAGHAVTGQGLTIIIGTLLGPLAVTSFATLRTLTRVNFQFTNVIAIAVWPELSSAFGRGDLSLARKLHRRAYQMALGLSVSGGLCLWLFGPLAYRLWTRHALALDLNCFHILIVVTLMNSLWYTSSVVAMSTNGHSRLALIFLTCSLFSLGLAAFLIHPLGTSGAAVSLLIVDLVMAWLVMRTALAKVQDTFPDLLASVIGISRPAREVVPTKPEAPLELAGVDAGKE